MIELTREEIAGMDKGRIIDGLIAEAFYDWSWASWGQSKLFVPSKEDKRFDWCAEWDEKGYPNYLPSYSENISQAFEVLDLVVKEPFAYHIESVNIVGGQKKYWIDIWGDDEDGLGGIKTFWAEGDSLPLSICKVLLLYKFGLEG